MKEQTHANLLEYKNEFTISDVLRLILRNWYWFVLSLLVCCSLAVVYIKSKPKVYTRTASVMIKNERGGGATESSSFGELKALRLKNITDDEIVVLKSNRLMLEVINKLDLAKSYKVKNGFRFDELYRRSPVKLVCPYETGQYIFSIQAIPLSSKKILLSGLYNDVEWSMQAILKDTVTTPVGELVIVPTPYYTKNYYGIPIHITKGDPKMVSLACRNSLQVSLSGENGGVINLRLNDTSPERSEDILNTLINVYNQDATNDRNKVAQNTSNFINERLAIIEKQLGSVDSDIEEFKRDNKLTDIHSEAGRYLESTSRYEQQSLELENQLALAQYIQQYLSDDTKQSELIPSNTGIADNNIEQQISEYNDLYLKREKLIKNSSNNNPVVMDMTMSLNAQRETITRAMDNVVNGLNVKIKNIRQKEMNTFNRISAVPTQQKHVLSIERQQKIKEELYLYLLNKREETALSQSFQESNIRLVDQAFGSNIPISPNGKRIFLIAFVLGLIIPGGGLWLKTISDTKVYGRKEIEEQLPIPFLGEIPYCNGISKKKDNLIVCGNGQDELSESFRIVRTNLSFLRANSRKVQVIMCTSFTPNAGKTFISSNLAMSFALGGKKVIQIDLDFRKATLTKMMDRKGIIGISDYLSHKENNIRKIINKNDFHPNIDMIYCGETSDNPADLLLNDRLDSLISFLKESYDYIILDNVPSNVIADAMIVNRVVDLTIYIIRAGEMNLWTLPEIHKLYKENKFNNMTVLLNGIRRNRSRFGYYKYNYCYGYGYGYVDEKRKRFVL